MFAQPTFSTTSPAPANGMPGAMPFPTNMPGQVGAAPSFGGVGMPNGFGAGFGATAGANGIGAPLTNGFGAGPAAPATITKAFSDHTTAFLSQNVLPVISQACTGKGLNFPVDEMIRLLGMTPPQSFGGIGFGAAPKANTAKVSPQQLGPSKCTHRYGARSQNQGQYCSEDALPGLQVCKTHNKGAKASPMGMFQGGIAPGFAPGIPGVMPNMPGYGQMGQMPGQGMMQQMPGQGMPGMMQQMQQAPPAAAPPQQSKMQARDLGNGQILELTRGLFVLQDASGFQVIGKVADISNPNPNQLLPLTHEDIQFAASNGLNRVHQQAMPQGAPAQSQVLPQHQGFVQQAPAQTQMLPQQQGFVQQAPVQAQPAQIPGLPTHTPVQIPGLPAQVPQATNFPVAQAPPTAPVQIPGLPIQAQVQAPVQAAPIAAQVQEIAQAAPVAAPVAVAIPAVGTIPEIPIPQAVPVTTQ